MTKFCKSCGADTKDHIETLYGPICRLALVEDNRGEKPTTSWKHVKHVEEGGNLHDDIMNPDVDIKILQRTDKY